MSTDQTLSCLEAVPADLSVQAGLDLMCLMPLSPPSMTHPAHERLAMQRDDVN